MVSVRDDLEFQWDIGAACFSREAPRVNEKPPVRKLREPVGCLDPNFLFCPFSVGMRVRLVDSSFGRFGDP